MELGTWFGESTKYTDIRIPGVNKSKPTEGLLEIQKSGIVVQKVCLTGLSCTNYKSLQRLVYSRVDSYVRHC